MLDAQSTGSLSSARLLVVSAMTMPTELSHTVVAVSVPPASSSDAFSSSGRTFSAAAADVVSEPYDKLPAQYDGIGYLPMSSSPIPEPFSTGSPLKHLHVEHMAEHVAARVSDAKIVLSEAKTEARLQGFARVDTFAEEQWRPSHLQKAFDAIAGYDLAALQVELGPNLFACDEKFAQLRRTNKMHWLEGKNTYLVLQKIKNSIRLYAKKHQDDACVSLCERTLKERGADSKVAVLSSSWPAFAKYKEDYAAALALLASRGIEAYEKAISPHRALLTSFATDELRMAPPPPAEICEASDAKDIAAAMQTTVEAEIEKLLKSLQDELEKEIKERVSKRLCYLDEDGLKSLFLTDLSIQHKKYLQTFYESLFGDSGAFAIFQRTGSFAVLQTEISARFTLATDHGYKTFHKESIELEKQFRKKKAEAVTEYKQQSKEWLLSQIKEFSYFSAAEFKQRSRYSDDPHDRRQKAPDLIADEYIQDILQSDIGAVSLRRLQDTDGTLFHHAVAAYKRASAEEKARALTIVKEVLLHGCHPYYLNIREETAFTYANRVVPGGDVLPDWRLNALVLECTLTMYETTLSRAKEYLLRYCKLTQQRLDSFLGRLRLNAAITEQRRAMLATLIASFVDSGDIGNHSVPLAQYHELASSVPRGKGGSSAFAKGAAALTAELTAGDDKVPISYNASQSEQKNSRALRQEEEKNSRLQVEKEKERRESALVLQEKDIAILEAKDKQEEAEKHSAEKDAEIAQLKAELERFRAGASGASSAVPPVSSPTLIAAALLITPPATPVPTLSAEDPSIAEAKTPARVFTPPPSSSLLPKSRATLPMVFVPVSTVAVTSTSLSSRLTIDIMPLPESPSSKCIIL